MGVGSLDDLDLPGARGRDRAFHFRSLIAGIGENRLDEGEPASRLTQHVARAVAILHSVGMNDDAQEKAERVDEDMTLAAVNLLARVKPLRVQSRAPF